MNRLLPWRARNEGFQRGFDVWFFAGGLRIGHLANGPLRNYSSVFMLDPSVASEFHFGPSETGNLKRKFGFKTLKFRFRGILLGKGGLWLPDIEGIFTRTRNPIYRRRLC